MCVGCMFRVMVMCIMVIMPKGIIWSKRGYGRFSYWRSQKFYCLSSINRDRRTAGTALRLVAKWPPRAAITRRH